MSGVITAETKTKELKGEKSSLEANILALKAEVREAFEARDAKEDENEELRKEIAGLRSKKELEIERLREENAKLQGQFAFSFQLKRFRTYLVPCLSKLYLLLDLLLPPFLSPRPERTPSLLEL